MYQRWKFRRGRGRAAAFRLAWPARSFGLPLSRRRASFRFPSHYRATCRSWAGDSGGERCCCCLVVSSEASTGAEREGCAGATTTTTTTTVLSADCEVATDGTTNDNDGETSTAEDRSLRRFDCGSDRTVSSSLLLAFSFMASSYLSFWAAGTAMIPLLSRTPCPSSRIFFVFGWPLVVRLDARGRRWGGAKSPRRNLPATLHSSGCFCGCVGSLVRAGYQPPIPPPRSRHCRCRHRSASLPLVTAGSW